MALSNQNPTTTLGELLPGVDLLEAARNLTVSGLSADSRAVKSGDLFIAFPGLTADGRQYLPQAFAAGAAAALVEAEGWQPIDGLQDQTVVPVVGLAAKVSGLAASFYGNASRQMRVTGVTGTNGKTTCTQLLAQLLSKLAGPAGVVGTLGYGVVQPADEQQSKDLLGEGSASLCDTGMTTPNAIQLQQILAGMHEEGVAHSFMEVSSHSLDQGRVAGVDFHTALFTNLSRDHLDYHGSFDAYATAKAALFARPELQLAVLNADDPESDHMKAQLASSVRCIEFAVDRTDVDVSVNRIELSTTGIRAQLHTPWGDGELRSSLVGEFNLSNLLAVISVACGQGYPLTEVLKSLPDLKSVAGRMEVVSTHLSAGIEPMVVVDYAHTPDALEKALVALRRHCGGELWCVFGCGGDRDTGKRPQMGAIAARLAHHVVVTSDNPRSENPEHIIVDILAGIPDELAVRVGADRALAIAEAIESAAPQDCVLIAGKGHENYQEVDGVRMPFSDAAQARQVLARREQAVRGGLH